MFNPADLRAAAITRRTWFALAALPRVRAGARCEAAGPPRVERVLLLSSRPWEELARACRIRGLHSPVRVVARPDLAWWPHASALPERWQAWIEFAGGTALVAECMPDSAPDAEHPQRISAVTRDVAEALLRGRSPSAIATAPRAVGR